MTEFKDEFLTLDLVRLFYRVIHPASILRGLFFSNITGSGYALYGDVRLLRGKKKAPNARTLGASTTGWGLMV